MASLKTRLLPIIIPCRGVDGTVWPVTAFQVMKEAKCLPCNPINGPLLRAPTDVTGEYMRRGLKTTEVSKALRGFLKIEEPASGTDNEVVTSHSLKATLLAWSARYGLSPQTRSLLGRHTSCLNETFAIYSRDLACAPAAELQRLIDDVHAGMFAPDGERSKFFRSACEQTDIPVKDEQQVSSDVVSLIDSPQAPGEEVPSQVEAGALGFVAGDDTAPESQLAPTDAQNEPLNDFGDETDSSSESCASSTEESDVQEPQARVKRFRAKIPSNEKWYVHSKSHLIHRFESDAQSDVPLLVCGKRLTGSYVACTEATAWNTLCKSCNRR